MERLGRIGMNIAIGILAVLALLALVNRAAALWSERRYPPQGRFVEVDGIRLHYVERGAGDAVVLIHGNGATVADFLSSGILDLLARDHRVIAFDRPGFGHSARPRGIWTATAQARLLRRALRKLGVQKPVIAGHSWGALVALSLALDDPDETAALVLLSGFLIPIPRADVAAMAWAGVPVLGSVVAVTIMPPLAWLTMPLLLRRIFAPNPVTQRFRKGFPLALALRPSQIKASLDDALLMIASAASLFPRCRELTLPVTIMAGDADAMVATEAQSARVHAVLPHSRFRCIAGAGHMIHHLLPDEVAAAIGAAGGR